MSAVDALGLTKKITRPRLAAFLKKYATEALTLDVGCGNSMYGELFPNRTTLDVEVRPGVQVDITADAHDLSVIADDTFECILCTEVLEHLHTPEQAMSEFYRILKPGGRLILSTRFIFPLHDAPGDYYRYTKYGLKHLFKQFEIEELQAETNTIETLAVLYQRLGFQCDTLWLKPFKMLWFLKAKVMLLFKNILTKEYGDIKHQQPESDILASGYYVVGKKAESPN